MRPSPRNIDAAIVGKLLADPALSALMPDGVFWGEAAQGATRFVIVSLAHDSITPIYEGHGIGDSLYLVKAVALATTGADTKAAEDRIGQLLEDQELTAAGYTWMATFGEQRIRDTEVDQIDPTIRWQHSGAYYRVQMSW